MARASVRERADMLVVGVGAGDRDSVEKIVDNPDHVSDLAVENLADPHHLVDVAVGAPHDFQGEPHRRERIPELMRQDAEEFVFALVDQPQRLRIDA